MSHRGIRRRKFYGKDNSFNIRTGLPPYPNEELESSSEEDDIWSNADADMVIPASDPDSDTTEDSAELLSSQCESSGVISPTLDECGSSSVTCQSSQLCIPPNEEPSSGSCGNRKTSDELTSNELLADECGSSSVPCQSSVVNLTLMDMTNNNESGVDKVSPLNQHSHNFQNINTYLVESSGDKENLPPPVKQITEYSTNECVKTSPTLNLHPSSSPSEDNDLDDVPLCKTMQPNASTLCKKITNVRIDGKRESTNESKRVRDKLESKKKQIAKINSITTLKICKKRSASIPPTTQSSISPAMDLNHNVSPLTGTCHDFQSEITNFAESSEILADQFGSNPVSCQSSGEKRTVLFPTAPQSNCPPNLESSRSSCGKRKFSDELTSNELLSSQSGSNSVTRESSGGKRTVSIAPLSQSECPSTVEPSSSTCGKRKSTDESTLKGLQKKLKNGMNKTGNSKKDESKKRTERSKDMHDDGDDFNGDMRLTSLFERCNSTSKKGNKSTQSSPSVASKGTKSPDRHGKALSSVSNQSTNASHSSHEVSVGHTPLAGGLSQQELNESGEMTETPRQRPARKAKKQLTYYQESEDDGDFSSDGGSVYELLSSDEETLHERRDEAREESDMDSEVDEHEHEEYSMSDREENVCDESDTDIPNDQQEPKANGKKRKEKGSTIHNHDWKEEDLPETVISALVSNKTVPPVKSPIEYFSYFFDNAILSLIVDETNRYSTQRHKTGESIELTMPELKVFLGIWILMGMCKLPSYHDYWKGLLRIPQIANLMSHRRFQVIRSRLHFRDNNSPANDDRFAHIRPLLDHLRLKCNNLNQIDTKFSIDESMVQYKGCKAGNLRQYMPKKPHKWGFKFFVLCGSSGIAYDFFPYAGAGTFPEENFPNGTKFNSSERVVIELCKKINLPRLSSVCFDNWFTSLPVISYLKKEYGLVCIGTLRKDRVQGCPLIPDNTLKKRGRGSIAMFKNQDDTIIVQWVDNNVVRMAGTWAGVEPKTVLKRWNKEERARVEVPCPRIVQLYNTHMGGVDLLDMMIQLYRIPSRAKRWPIAIAAYLIDLCLVNSYFLYVQDFKANQSKNSKHSKKKEKPMSSKAFRLNICSSLFSSDKKRGRPSLQDLQIPKQVIRSPVTPRPADEVRFDDTDHWPGFNEKRGRCKICKDGYTAIKCLKCGVHLCLVPTRNCFVQFHNPGREDEEDSDVSNDSVDLGDP